MIPLPRLYAIADASLGNPVQLTRSLFEGGARLVQIRNKAAGAGELFDQVKQILSFAPPDATVLVNDRVDVALLTGAHGVHLGQDDLPVVYARQILGTHTQIGFSTHTLEQALKADLLAVDYIAVGPIFPTQTKGDASAVVGLEQLEQILPEHSKTGRGDRRNNSGSHFGCYCGRRSQRSRDQRITKGGRYRGRDATLDRLCRFSLNA